MCIHGQSVQESVRKTRFCWHQVSCYTSGLHTLCAMITSSSNGRHRWCIPDSTHHTHTLARQAGSITCSLLARLLSLWPIQPVAATFRFPSFIRTIEVFFVTKGCERQHTYLTFIIGGRISRICTPQPLIRSTFDLILSFCVCVCVCVHNPKVHITIA